MIEIDTGFSKISYGAASYDVEGIASWILGESESPFLARRKLDLENEWCGFILPPFQRGEAWDEGRKIRLMESLFCGIDIGPLLRVSNFDHPEVDAWLLDGRQRLSAIRDFVLGRLAIFDGKLSYGNMDGVTLRFRPQYRDDPVNAPKRASIAWKGISVRIGKLESVHDVEVLKELYDRLNFGGVPHMESERARPRRAPGPGAR